MQPLLKPTSDSIKKRVVLSSDVTPIQPSPNPLLKDKIPAGATASSSSAQPNALDTQSVLHRTWKPIIACAWAYFIVWQIAIALDREYSPAPLCPYSDQGYGQWYDRVMFFVLGGFVLIWLLLVVRIVQFESGRKRLPLVVALNIVSMGTIATFLAVVFEAGGTCIDVLNVASPAAIWGEWIACGALLIYITVTIVDRPGLTWKDWGLMGTFTMCLITGFFIVPAQPIGSGQFWLFVSCITYVPVLYLPWYNPANIDPADAEKMPKHVADSYAQQVNLARWLTIVLPFYTVNYLVATWGGIDAPTTIAIYQVLSLLTKGLFAGIAMDAHVDLLIAAERALLDERRATAARRAFMKYIFHEVRTPLSSIAMGIEIIKENEHVKESEQEPLLMMQMACEFMSETLDGVLSMQKIEEGKLDLEIAPFSLAREVEKCTFMFKSVAAQLKKIRFDVRVSPDVPALVEGDRYRVLHILSNLVSNAIKVTS